MFMWLVHGRHSDRNLATFPSLQSLMDSTILTSTLIRLRSVVVDRPERRAMMCAILMLLDGEDEAVDLPISTVSQLTAMRPRSETPIELLSPVPHSTAFIPALCNLRKKRSK